MDLNDKAKETPDIDLLRDAQYSGYRLVSTELTPADELTDEGEFPQFGDFLQVALPDGSDSPPVKWIECPQGLAQALVELDLGDGDEFRIEAATKVDGEWQVTVEPGAEKS